MKVNLHCNVKHLFVFYLADSRYINIYNREGILQNTNEIIEGLEECISWRYITITMFLWEIYI